MVAVKHSPSDFEKLKSSRFYGNWSRCEFGGSNFIWFEEAMNWHKLQLKGWDAF